MWFKCYEHFHLLTSDGRTDGRTHTGIIVRTFGYSKAQVFQLRMNGPAQEILLLYDVVSTSCACCE